MQSDVDAHTVELRFVSQELWGAVRGVVRAARDADEEVRDRISMDVLQGVQPLVEMESAWYLPFGFEPSPTSISRLDELLARGADSVT